MAAKLKLDLIVDDKGSVVVKKFSKGAQSSLDIAKKSAVALGVGLAGATAALAVLYQGTKAVIGPASDLQETTSKFNVVFADQIKIAESWSETLVDSYAMSRRESKEYLSSIQDLLVPMGMVAEKAGAMSFEVTKLAADLGSFNNMPTARVMGDIQSALVGNYETMKKYGVVLNATVVQEKALAMGLAKTKAELTAGQKAQASYALMVAGSAAAIGDQQRTMGSYANQMKKYRALIEDVKVEYGEKLLPVATDAIKTINEMMKDLLDSGQLAEWGDQTAVLVKNYSELIKQNMPAYIEKTSKALQKIWDIISYDPAIIEWGIVGLAFGGKKGAVILGGMGHMVTWAENIGKAFGLAAAGVIDFKDIASANFKELEALIKKSEVLLGGGKSFKIGSSTEGWDLYIGKAKEEFAALEAEAEAAFASMGEAVSLAHLPMLDYYNLIKDMGQIIPDISGKELMEFPAMEPDMTQTGAYMNAMDEFRTVERQKMQEYLTWKKTQEKSSWDVMLGYAQGYLGQVSGVFKQIADAGGKHSKEAFDRFKSIAIAEAAIGGALAIMQIMGDKLIHPYVKGAFIAVAAGITAAQMAIITASEPHAAGGWIQGGSGTRDDVLLGTTKKGGVTTAHWGMGGEFVVNQQAARRYGGLLEVMNEKYAAGGWVNKGYGSLFGDFDPVGNIFSGLGDMLFGGMLSDIRTWTLEDEFEKLGDELQTIIDGIELTTFEQEMKNLQKWFDDSLDTLVELTEAGLDTTEMAEDLAKTYRLQAEEIREANIELARQQLMGAWSMQDTISELASPRSGGGMEQWIGHFDLISERIGQLDENSESYMQDLLSLTEDQVGVLNHIRDLQAQAVKELESSISSIDDMILSLTGGDLAPVQSAEFFQTQYDTLLAGATTPEGLKDFQDFIPEYLKFMESYGGDYNALVQKVTGDLQGVRDVFEDQLDVVSALLGGIGVNTDPIQDLLGLTDVQTTAINNMSTSVDGLITTLITLAGEAVTEAEEGLTEAEGVTVEEDVAQTITDAITPEQAETVAAITPAEEALDWINDQIEGIAKTGQIPRDQGEALQGLQSAARSIQQGGRDAWDTINWVNAMQDTTLDRRQHGGLTQGRSLAGEVGPEWVVPTYEPERSSFLRDVGADPEAIGAAVARHIMALDAGGKKIHINLVIDGKQIGNVVANQVGQNRELNQAIRQVN